MDNKQKVGAVVIVIVVGLILTIPMTLLWNYSLVPAIPVLQEVSVPQMYGIYLLCIGLFKT